MCLHGLVNKIVATQLLKDDSLKSKSQLNQYQPFEPYEPHVIFVEYDMYLRLIYFLNLENILDGYQIARVWRN